MGRDDPNTQQALDKLVETDPVTVKSFVGNAGFGSLIATIREREADLRKMIVSAPLNTGEEINRALGLRAALQEIERLDMLLCRIERTAINRSEDE